MCATIRSYLLSLRRLYRKRFSRRSMGLRAEIAFWDHWFRTHGASWPEDYRQRLDPQRPLITRLRPFVDAIPHENVSILDVGAGPLTLIGFIHPTKQLRITATDLLAPQYDALLARYHIIPPVRTIAADAEQLDRLFGSNQFDIVHAQNCIDHMASPLVTIRAMVAVTKQGDWVVLSHAENEAENENYTGIHQWNLTTDGTDFMVWGRGQIINVSTDLIGKATVQCQLANRWLSVHIYKLPA